eukprot:SAG31_NODE_1868_length_7028_cov_4.100303_5_plen_74_part_00
MSRPTAEASWLPQVRAKGISFLEWAENVYNNDELAAAWGWTDLDDATSTFSTASGGQRNLTLDDAIRQFGEQW